MSHLFANVPDIYQASSAQLKPHNIARKELRRRFNFGFKPVRQCKNMVNVRAATDASDAAVSYT
jgi:hypothetical protein